MTLISRLQQLLSEQRPLFAFRGASQDQVKIIIQEDRAVKHQPINEKDYAVMSPFDGGQAVFLHADKTEHFVFAKTDLTERQISPHFESAEKKRYKKLVEKAIARCQSGDLFKVVLSRKRTIKTFKDSIKLIEQLFSIDEDANCYFFHHPEVGTWMGATPELLLSVKGKVVKTASLAGTAVHNGTLDHQWGEKEKIEQEYVTDSIQKIFNRHARQVNLNGPYTIKAGNLIHLKTDIQGIIQEDSVHKLLAELHPTPAVCGLPKERAKEFIFQNENHDREFYTGYFGIVDQQNKSADYYVNLRCMKLEGVKVQIYVGGGVVEDSDPAAEYEETVHKESTMLRLLTD
jgi:isochorismate synthase